MQNTVLISTDGSLFSKTIVSRLDKLSIQAELCGWSAKKIMAALEKEYYDLVCITTIGSTDELRALTNMIHEKYSGIKILLTVCTESESAIASLRISERVKCAVLPQSADRLAEIIRRMLEEKKGSIYSYIADYMYFLGLRKKYDGFSYLCSAVELCLEDSSRINAIVKRVYAEVGEIYGVSSSIIERSIRYLSKAAYEDGIVPRLTKGQINDKLTNYELICAVGDSFLTRRMR
ncbi:MAG: hypothetical protein IJ487_01195 [Ruminococcus sp.]|nr:hypothetical protein [Ruminococcus sp.]